MIKRIALVGFVSLGAVVIYSVLSKQEMPDGASGPMKRAYVLPTTYEEHRKQQSWFDTRDGRLAYTDHGGFLNNEPGSNATEETSSVTGSINSIPTIVLIHGVPTSSWMYRKLIHGLQGQLRVISVDLLGFGASDKPVEPQNVYDTEKQAQRVADLLAHLNIDSYSILVHDMGGLVGWELLRQRAPVKDLVILNSIVRQEGFNSPSFDKGMFSKVMTKAYSSDLTSSVMLKRTFDSMGMATTYKLSEAECRGYVVPIADGSDTALYHFFTGLNSTLFERLEQNAQDFNEFEGRALVLWGAKDTILTTKQIPFLQQHLSIADEDIHIFDEQNHFLAEEIPDKISEQVLDFMAQ